MQSASSMWKKLAIYLSKNWKTTLGSVLIGLILILSGADIISADVSEKLIALLTMFGLAAAKDADKTGV